MTKIRVDRTETNFLLTNERNSHPVIQRVRNVSLRGVSTVIQVLYDRPEVTRPFSKSPMKGYDYLSKVDRYLPVLVRRRYLPVETE